MTRAPEAPRMQRCLLDAAALAGAILAVGVAVWLVPASVHIVSFPRLAQRVAVFAPLYVLTRVLVAAAAAIGLVVVLFRRHPERAVRLANVAAPLNLLWIWLLPYLPWLGDRFPLLLVLAGPVRWLFVALAAMGVAARWRERRHSDSWRVVPGAAVVFAVSLVVYLVLGFRSHDAIGLGGDEPHYLVITHSLLADGDLRIENNHERGDYRAFFGGTLRPDYLQRGRDGAIYSIHAPGLSALLIPAYLVAGAKGAVAAVAGLAALAALAIFLTARALGGAGVAWLVWAVVCLTVPFVPYAWALYPEMAGAAVVAWAVLWWMDTAPVSSRAWMGRGVCCAVLPWLHTKFSVLLAGLVLMFVWKLRAQRAAVAAMLAPIALSGVAWLAFFYVIYGSLNPEVPYGSYAAQFVRLQNLPRSLLGLGFDQKFGLLVYAPVYLFVAVGLWKGRRDPRILVPALLAFVYVVSSARLYMWWGGSSAPARFLVPVLPLVAPALASTATGLRRTGTASGLAACALVSLVVAAVGVTDARDLLLFSPPHGVARMVQLVQGSAPLMSALPTFTEENWTRPAAALLPWLVAAALAAAVAGALARRAALRAWVAGGTCATFLIAGALLVASFPPPVRGESAARGAEALLQSFDPHRRRAFDLARWSRLSPAEWLSRATVVFDRTPGTDVDRLGRVSDALVLPAGKYEARVWFDGTRARAGRVEAIVASGGALARLDEPLANPSLLSIDLPVAAPALWIGVSDPESNRAVRRVELTARDIDREPASGSAEIRTVEPLPSRPGAYLAYADDNAFPENGVFWTRATARARVFVVPAGAGELELVLHVGPVATVVWLEVADEPLQKLELAAEETRAVRLPMPPGRRAVPIAVRAESTFVPAAVDPRSTDRRVLGCQVRILVE